MSTAYAPAPLLTASRTARPSRIHPTTLRGWRLATTQPTPPKAKKIRMFGAAFDTVRE
jgi:hypothetical protein